MQRYEYKVVPAPQKGTKAKGVKTPEGRFATSIEQLLNTLGQEGWEYQRAELLPSEERTGLTGSTVNWRNVLVFRRAIVVEQPVQPAPLSEPTPMPEPDPDAAPAARPIPGPDDVLTPQASDPPVAAPAPISEPPKDPPLTLTSTAPASEDVDPKDRS